MLESAGFPEVLLERAIAAVEAGEDGLLTTLDALPVPIYVTGADGVVTHFNAACADFAGRAPIAGQDRWCVTWKLYTDCGQFLPHDACPMADAIRQQRPIRGATAFAERPDGTRVCFVPYPTPLFREDGTLRCAVNMLIDVTDRRQAESLRVQAAKCRYHARRIGDDRAKAALMVLAQEYDAKAADLDSAKASTPS